MSECTNCIYRYPKTFKICGKKCDENSSLCPAHNKHVADLYEIYHIVFGKKKNIINTYDIYRLYIYVYDKIQFQTNELEHSDMVKVLFIELLRLIPKSKLSDAFSKYKIKKLHFYNKIYELNHFTYRFSKKHDVKILQNMTRQFIRKHLVITLDSDNIAINSEDPFTYDNIDELSSEVLFTYRDNNNNIYAFNAIELDFFIKKCKKENTVPYNPYTREILDERLFIKLNLFIKYNRLKRRNSGCMWESELHAFTDLSFEIEKRGFYNSPDWFLRMDRQNIIKAIKMFKDFSANIYDNEKYFKADIYDITDNKSFVYKFCKDGIKLFQECNEDLYILCCNFIKALAMCSKDFYDNIPEWLLGTNTNSRLSDVYSFLTDDILDNFGILRNDVRSNNTDNFLLYYYVEYMQ